MAELPAAEDAAIEFFRTFVEPERLRLGGLLVGAWMSISDLTRLTGIETKLLMKHLSRIDELGLLVTRGDGADRRYSIDESRIRALASAALRNAQTTGPTDERGKTLRTFFPGGRLTQMPVQQRKQLYILAEVAGLFRPGSTYYESDVNGILSAVSEDHFGTLRRMLVDFGFLKRDNMLGGAVYTKGLSVQTVLFAHGITDEDPSQVAN